MSTQSLQNCAILIVEDEYLLADDLATELRDHGATVVGPAATIEQALALLAENPPLDGAVLDVNLRGQPIFPVADELAGRGVPFVFATGYDSAAIPERFGGTPRCEKPLRLTDLVKALARVTHA